MKHHVDTLAQSLTTLRDLLRYAVSRFTEEKCFFGHGSDNAFDEAAYLLLHSLHLPLDRLEPFLDAHLLPHERKAALHLIERRAGEHIPAAYLTQEAWLGDYRFYCDERVIVPRSYFAELLESGLAPWVPEPEAVTHVLDMCTGSGCLAILMALAYPNAIADAIDISPDALQVAQRNIDDYQLGHRVRAINSDLFAAVGGQRYDLIISNPPYVTTEAMRALPQEYRFEPTLALGAGEDGLDIVRRILEQAPNHLTDSGVLAIEVGHNRAYVEHAFPELQLTWLSTQNAEDVVFLITREQLAGT
jgi:ribosomal protein L3 glutamine methyltransferase